MKKMPDCIVAAAGRSSRMGEWKPGLPWGEAAMAVHTVQQALKAGCRVIVGGGYRYRALRRMFRGIPGVTTIKVLRWRLGMGYTVRKALSLAETNSVFVVPADMPKIKIDDYLRLSNEMDRVITRDGEIVDVLRPTFEGKPGHPVLLSQTAVRDLTRSIDGTPMRVILGKYRNMIIKWDHPGVVQDMDTPEDYEKVRLSAYDHRR